MNEKIVKNAVNNFIDLDPGFNSELIREGFEKFLWESIRQMRREDPFLYDEIRSLSSMNQTKLLEQRLEMEFVDIDMIIEDVGDAVLRACSKAFEINEFLGEEYIEEYSQSIMGDTFQFLSEDSILRNKFTEWGMEKVKTLIKDTARSLPAITILSGAKIGAIISGGWLGFLVMFFFLSLCAGVTNYFTSKHGLNLPKEQLTALKDLVDSIYWLAKKVKGGTEKYKYMYNLTYTNEQKCYQKAGLDVNKLGLRHVLSMKEDSWWNNLLIASESVKLDTLKRCYLESFLDKISIFFNLYFDCLKKTGDWNQVKRMPDDKFITMFRTKGGFYPSCDQFRDNAVKALNSFEDLVSWIYEKTPEKKSQWMLLLNRYILDQKASQDELKKDFNEKMNKKPAFVSGKYKKLGSDLDGEDNYYLNNKKGD